MEMYYRSLDGRELTAEEAADLVIEHVCIDDKTGTITLTVAENVNFEKKKN